MSDTPVDMAKVTQMLDAGWQVCIYKNEMNTYTASAECELTSLWERARNGCLDQLPDQELRDVVEESDWDEPGRVTTDDFTPEQALTRLAYKVHGEVI